MKQDPEELFREANGTSYDRLADVVRILESMDFQLTVKIS